MGISRIGSGVLSRFFLPGRGPCPPTPLPLDKTLIESSVLLVFLFVIFFLASPSKDFGVRVSDQLNALRTLLENRLIEQDKTKPQKKESSILQTSPGTFARQFLQSFRQSSLENNSTEFNSDIDDDDKEVERNFNLNHHNNNNNNEKIKQYDGDILTTSTTSSNQHGYSSIHQHHNYQQMIQPSLSSLSDELNQARVSSTVISSSTPTIASNLAAKIDTRKLK
jgi:hypothetical protein